MLPQTPKNLLEYILCDADLDHLGRDDFYTIGQGLHDEWRNFGRIQSEEEWNAIQVTFLEKHKYWINTSQRLRGPEQGKHPEELRQTRQQKN